MTLPEILANLERRAGDAERLAATAPVAVVLRQVVAELVTLGDGTSGNGKQPPAEGDRLLRAQEVAKRLGCSARYVYAHAGRFPFTVRVGGLVRFSELRFDRWLARTTT